MRFAVHCEEISGGTSRASKVSVRSSLRRPFISRFLIREERGRTGSYPIPYRPQLVRKDLALYDPRHVPQPQRVARTKYNHGRQRDVRPSSRISTTIFGSRNEEEREAEDEHPQDHAEEGAEEEGPPPDVID